MVHLSGRPQADSGLQLRALVVVLVATLAAGLGLLGAGRAEAFSLYGTNIYWHDNHTPSGPTTPCGRHSTGSYVTCAPTIVTFPLAATGHNVWKSTWDGNLREAEFLFNAFAVAPDGLRIFYRYRDGGGCPACITDFGGVGMFGQRFNYCNGCLNVLGQTQLDYYSDGEIISAEIEINDNPSVPWALGTATPTSSQISLTQTIMHELGHAAGLRHPVLGPNSGVLMQCKQALGEGQAALGSDDTNGLAYLYLVDRSHGSPVSNKC